MNMKNIKIATLAALSFFAKAHANELSDLSPFETKKLDVVLRTIDIGQQTPGVFYDVSMSYTNPIVCDVDVAIPVLKNGSEGIFEISQTDVIIFPPGGFDSSTYYKVDTARLPAGALIQKGIENKLKGAATCQGWPLGKHLPRRVCEILNPQHDQSCRFARQADKNYYPLIRNNLHFGDCGC